MAAFRPAWLGICAQASGGVKSAALRVNESKVRDFIAMSHRDLWPAHLSANGAKANLIFEPIRPMPSVE
jgi:hypothetical protein